MSNNIPQTFNFELFFNMHLDLLCISSAAGEYLAVNQAFERILGYTSDELYMKPILSFVHPDDVQNTINTVSTLQEGDNVLNFTNRVRTKSGEYKFIEWRAHPSGDVVYSAARDITKYRIKEDELKHNQMRLQAMLESQSNYIMRLSLDFEYLYCNSKYLQDFLAGRTMEEVANVNCFNFVPQQQHEVIKDCYEKCKANIGTAFQIELATPINEIDTVYHIWECVCLPDNNGNPLEYQSVGVDITERKIREAKLKEQKEIELLEMSTPITELWDGILLLPLVGMVTAQRAQNLMSSVLDKIATSQAQVFILDISGVPVVDTAVANHFIKLAKATKLMGCLCTMSGITPAVAQTIIELGIQIEEVNTTGTMKDALEKALNKTGLKLVTIH